MDCNYIILPKTSDQNLLAQYYSLADVFVICSKKENFPTTCVEAQCCGTPVVGFDAGGTKETSILSSEDFVEYGDVSGLANVVSKRIIGKTDKIAEQAQEEYSKETMAKKYKGVYDEQGRKERILLIDVNCKNSSTGKIVYDLYSSLREDGRSAAICYGRGKKIEEENIYKFGLDWETNIHAGLSRITGYNGCFSYFSTCRLIKYIDAFKPDLIHIHELHAYFVNIKTLIEYIKSKNIPIVWTFHCEYMYTGKCGHAYDCISYQKNCGHCPAVKDYPKSLFFDKTKQMFNMKKTLLNDFDFTIVTPSKWLADRVKTSFLKKKKIEVIHNGIDTDIFRPVDATEIKKKLNIPDGNKIVLALAPNIMSEAKGGNLVLKLADTMKKKNVFFVLVGI